jgi:hypothetical protein
MSMIRALVVAAAVVVFVAGSPGGAPAGPGPGSGGAQVVKVEGLVAGVNLMTGQVAITTRAGVTLTVVVAPGTKVERNGRRATLAAFKLGDRVQVVASTSGVAVKIEAVGP